MGVVNIDLNNINLDNNFDEDNPDSIILIRLLVWHTKFEKRKALKNDISEELMPVAWHTNRIFKWVFNFSIFKFLNGEISACQKIRKKK